MSTQAARVWRAGIIVAIASAASTGCVGAALVVGAAAGGVAVHEYPKAKAMKQLNDDFYKEPTHSYAEFEEYLRRKHQIQEQSWIY